MVLEERGEGIKKTRVGTDGILEEVWQKCRRARDLGYGLREAMDYEKRKFKKSCFKLHIEYFYVLQKKKKPHKD